MPVLSNVAVNKLETYAKGRMTQAMSNFIKNKKRVGSHLTWLPQVKICLPT